MNSFTEKFHNATDGNYPYVRIAAIRISNDGKKTAVEIIYDKKHADEYKNNRQAVINEIKSLLPPDAYPEYEDRAVDANAEAAIGAVYEYLKGNNAFLMYAVTKEMISVTTGESMSVRLTLPRSVYQYFMRGGFKEKLGGYLSSLFFCACILDVRAVDENREEIKKALNVVIKKAKYTYEREGEGRIIVPTEREKLIGELIEDNAVYICDCNEAQNYTVVCGIVSDYKIREYTSQKDNKKKKFCTFVLSDATGSIKCSYFPRAGDESKTERLYDGIFLLLSGKTEYDEYLSDGSVKLSVRRITFAKMQENFRVNDIVRLPADDYFHIRPVKKQFAGQYSLSEEKESRIGAPLVVFELKTAAVKGKSGMLLEIGAVKIIDGRIMYTFWSLIRPEVKVPPKLAKAIGHNENDYLHEPSFEQVLPDFYLFTQGCDVTAYPSSENFSALSAAYRKLHIPFDRMQDISVFVDDVDIFKTAKPASSRTALAFAEAYANILL